LRKIKGTRNTARSHRPSSPRLVQGSRKRPGVEARLLVVGVAVEVVKLSFKFFQADGERRVYGVWPTFIYGHAGIPGFLPRV
jgi:hypothetical protein